MPSNMDSRYRSCCRQAACFMLCASAARSFVSQSCFFSSSSTALRTARAAPKLEIFVSNVKLKVPAGEQCHGRRLCGPLPSSATSPYLTSSSGKVNPPPGQWSPVQAGKGPDDDGSQDEFNINVGRALDYLAVDVGLMFCTAPRLEIFTSNIRLKDPVGELCHGRRLYGALHTSLRVLGAITTSRPRVGVTNIMFHAEEKEIELKWTMTASAPFMGDAVKLSAVSLYRLNEQGFIYEHSIDNRIKRDLWEYSHSWMGVLKADSPPSA